MLAKSCKMARQLWVDHSKKWRNFFGGTPKKMTGTERVKNTIKACFKRTNKYSKIWNKYVHPHFLIWRLAIFIKAKVKL